MAPTTPPPGVRSPTVAEQSCGPQDDRAASEARRPPHLLHPYLVGLLGVVLATVVRLPFEGWLEWRAPYALYFLPILYVAWSGNAGATAATTVLSLLAAKLFLVPERYSLTVAPDEWGSVVLFLLAAVPMSLLSRRAARLRDHAVRNEQACRRAERGARAAVWEWDSGQDNFESVGLPALLGSGVGPWTSLEALEAMVDPADRKHLRAALARARDDGSPIDVEFRVHHPTAGLRWFTWKGETTAAGRGRWYGLAMDVTERKAAEQSAAVQREWFEVTLKSIGDAVIACDREGHITFLNQVAETLTGWPAAEAQGRPLSEVFRIVNESTREPAHNPVDKVMRTGVVIGLANHTALVARDGTERPIADSAAPIVGKDGGIRGVILVFHDVTEERRANDAIAEQREWFQKTLESIGDGVIASDVRGRVVFMNPVAEYLTGTRLEDARDRDCAEVFRIVNETTRNVVESPVGRVLREGNIVGLANHTVLIASNGVERPIDDSGAPIRALDGRIVGVVLVFRDVSERRTAELDKQLATYERERLLDSERAARADAERANRLKDEFVATLSHELRTPLNAVLGWVRVLQTTPNDAATLAQALAVIERNTRIQAQLLSDLMDINRIMAGKLRLEPMRVDLHEVVEAACETIAAAAAARRIQFHKQLEAVPPVMADPARLQQVVWNLLANAVKFTPEGGRIELSVRALDAFAEICVRDNGRGIRPDFLPHVFDRFRQADASLSREVGGLGIGLAIVKQLVELHGGRVVAESAGEGQGATFRVRLPIGADAAEPTPAGDQGCARIAQIAADRLRGLRVLVVDDDADGRELASRLLTECGATVRLATSGAEALAMLGGEPCDILVCDIGMPRMDGYQLMQALRRSPDPRIARLPAIALTAFARPEDRSQALHAGYQAHLAKPMDPAELIATVASFASLMERDPRGPGR